MNAGIELSLLDDRILGDPEVKSVFNLGRSRFGS